MKSWKRLLWAVISVLVSGVVFSSPAYGKAGTETDAPNRNLPMLVSYTHAPDLLRLSGLRRPQPARRARCWTRSGGGRNATAP